MCIRDRVLYKVVDLLVPLRVTAEQEALGLDLSQHGESVGEMAEALLPPAHELPIPAAKAGAPQAYAA